MQKERHYYSQFILKKSFCVSVHMSCSWCPGRWVSIRRCFHCGHSPMPAWERLKLNPFQKWKLYGLPPWKFFFNILLIITSTVNVYQLSSTFTPYKRAQANNWESMLIPDSLSSHTIGVKTTYYVFSIEDFMETVEQFITQYFTLNITAVGTFLYLNADDSNDIQPIEMYLKTYEYPQSIFNPSVDQFDGQSISKSYNIYNQSSVYGPFCMNISDTQSTLNNTDIIHSLISMKLTFKIQNMGYNNGYRTCYVDTVQESFDFYYRGRIDVQMQSSVYICTEQYSESIWDRQYIVLVIFLSLTFVLSSVSELLAIKAVMKHISIYRMAKSANKKEWRELNISQKLEFFNVWFIASTVGNVSNVVGSAWCERLLVVETKTTAWDIPLFLIGIGCMFAWISSIQYLEMFPNYYSLILTLKKSSPRVLAFLVGVLPVFLGFAFFGVAYFSSGSELFSDVDKASVSLFALLNGDVIHDVFDNIYDISPFISRVYLYLFISLFIYAVLNIFIAIVEDAFFAAKQECEHEIEQNEEQKKFNVSDLDVVQLVQGPPVSIREKSLAKNESYSGCSTLLLGRHMQYNSPALLKPLSRAQLLLFDINSSIEEKEAQKRNAMFMKTLKSMMISYNDQFLNDITKTLMNIESNLRPPHSFDEFPCNFSDCIYCKTKSILQSNLHQLRDDVVQAIQSTVDEQEQELQSTI